MDQCRKQTGVTLTLDEDKKTGDTLAQFYYDSFSQGGSKSQQLEKGFSDPLKLLSGAWKALTQGNLTEYVHTTFDDFKTGL